MSTLLELLAPAKNAHFGMAAIDHGADAVYIGGPAFGARASAGNDVADIEKLAAYAHRYGAKIFVALNTILKDEELEEAARMTHRIYQAGADALIVQDMGLLEMDLPPIQLHASTQTDNRSLDKVRFLQDVGFSQIVLARELSLKQIRTIANGTAANLEFFVHGALCVSYSGQCYISHAHTGRSANRGECSQACRLPYDLTDADGTVVAQEQHLLSMKDNDQSANLRALADAGIRSFKIEGRLKDLSYVKNITAHYRTLLDGIMAEAPEYRPAAAGRCQFHFTPQPEKTFNRGATDYFVNERKTDIGAFDSPSFMGEAVGKLIRRGDKYFDLVGTARINNGDGLCYFDDHGELVGLRINRAELLAKEVAQGQRLYPAAPAGDWGEDLQAGTELFRNRDQEFERILEKKSAERRIPARLRLSQDGGDLVLSMSDEDYSVSLRQPGPFEAAQQADKALTNLREQLGKLGNSLFTAEDIRIDLLTVPFLPASVINGLRRRASEELEATRIARYQRPPRAAAVQPPAEYPENELSYLGNVYNEKARAFYTRHGVNLIEDAYEANREAGAVSLMITKHCLRYSFNLCPKQVKGIKPEPMTLLRGKEKLTLRFDCKRCEMHVIGKLKKSRVINLVAKT